jgi:uncharacterized membrane protein
MNNKYIVSWIFVAAGFLIGLIAYPALPQMVASHWSIRGQVNGYQNKVLMIVLLPLISAIVTQLLWFLPRIDPRRENFRSFRRIYENFILFLSAFLLYVHLLSIIWNLGLKFDIIEFLTPAFALLIYGLGVVLPEARPNWIFGIRTPWTMSNGRVWFHTHELAGRIYKAAGVLSLGAFFWPSLALYLLIGPLLVGSIYLMVFSYFDWRRETSRSL